MTVSPEKIAEMLAGLPKDDTYAGFPRKGSIYTADLRSILTELTTLRSQLSGITDETSSDPSMWATVVESEYDGSLRWDCHTAGDMGDGDSLPTITLAADTFPAGTKLEIKEPTHDQS
jgi:hypothetical protein